MVRTDRAGLSPAGARLDKLRKLEAYPTVEAPAICITVFLFLCTQRRFFMKLISIDPKLNADR